MYDLKGDGLESILRYSICRYQIVVNYVYKYTVCVLLHPPRHKGAEQGVFVEHTCMCERICVCVITKMVKVCDNSVSRFEYLSRFGLESTC